jgi:MFS family permease
MVLWGIGMGSLESIIKAALAEMVPRDRRATGYGIFNAGFGLFWFLGSALMGLLYEFSLGALVAFSVTAQLLAIPVFLAVSRRACLQPR